MRVIAIDFDNTLYDGIDIIEKGRALLMKYYREPDTCIIIYTARRWEDFFIVKTILDFERIPYDAIVCEKLRADLYIDDKAEKFEW